MIKGVWGWGVEFSQGSVHGTFRERKAVGHKPLECDGRLERRAGVCQAWPGEQAGGGELSAECVGVSVVGFFYVGFLLRTM